MTSWHSYPKVHAVGHAAISGLLEGDLTVEEKVDGSQFSFGVHNGELKVRSKGREFDINAPDKLFQLVCGTVLAKKDCLKEGWTYRGEAVCRPKHNVLTYRRIPVGGFVLFDVETDLSSFLSYEEKQEEAARLRLEVVPRYHQGPVSSPDLIQEWLSRESFLGGPKIEGVVLKDYSRFDRDGKIYAGKYVSEDFKEVHKKQWKEDNPAGKDILSSMCAQYGTEPRWRKAVQHLRDNGALENSPKDIGALIQELSKDIEEECAEEIKEQLFKWAWPHIKRAASRGFPEWYKEQLLKGEFDARLSY